MIHVIRHRKSGKWYVRKVWLAKASISFEEYETAMSLAFQLAKKDKLSIVVYDCGKIKTTSIHPDGPGTIPNKDTDQLNFFNKIYDHC